MIIREDSPITRIRWLLKNEALCPHCVLVKKGRAYANRAYSCSFVRDTRGRVLQKQLVRPLEEVHRCPCHMSDWLECPMRRLS